MLVLPSAPMRRALLAVTLLLLGSLPSPAQSTHCVLPVSVTDADSEFIERLGSDNFSLEIGASTAAISSVERQVTRNVVLLLDSSRQMSGSDQQRNRQLLLLYWLAASAPSKVSLVAYTGKIDAILDGKEKVLAELNSHGSKREVLGGDSVYMSALLRTAKAMEVRPGDVIFVIGPAFKPTVGSDREELLRILQQRGIRLFYMQLYFPSWYAVRFAPELNKEAKLSGGFGFMWPELSGPKSKIEDVRDRLVNQMYRYYLLGFDWPTGVSRDSSVKVEHHGNADRPATLLYPARPVCDSTSP